MKTLLAVTSLALVLTGCAALEQWQPQRESTALQVMQAAGQAEGLSDLSAPAAALADRAALVAAAQAALVQELAPANVGRAEPVVYPVQAAFMTPAGRTEPTLHSRAGLGLIAWMPAHLARDETAAQLLWSETLEQAAARALPEGYETEPFEWVDMSAEGVESTHRTLRVRGPLCLEWTCVLDGAFTSREDPSLSVASRLARVATPALVAHQDAESFTLVQADHLTLRIVTAQYLEVGDGKGRWYRMETQPLAEFDINAYYQRLSAELPEWAYIFVGSENPLYRTDIPVVLHQGKELFFAVPGAGRR